MSGSPAALMVDVDEVEEARVVAGEGSPSAHQSVSSW